MFASCLQRMIRIDHALAGGICTRYAELLEASTKTLHGTHGRNFSVVAHLEAFAKTNYNVQGLTFRITSGREGGPKFDYELSDKEPAKPEGKVAAMKKSRAGQPDEDEPGQS